MSQDHFNRDKNIHSEFPHSIEYRYLNHPPLLRIRESGVSGELIGLVFRSTRSIVSLPFLTPKRQRTSRGPIVIPTSQLRCIEKPCPRTVVFFFLRSHCRERGSWGRPGDEKVWGQVGRRTHQGGSGPRDLSLLETNPRRTGSLGPVQGIEETRSQTKWCPPLP